MDLKQWLKNHHYSTRCRLSDQTPTNKGIIRGYSNGMLVLCHVQGYLHDIVPVKVLKKPSL